MSLAANPGAARPNSSSCSVMCSPINRKVMPIIRVMCPARFLGLAPGVRPQWLGMGRGAGPGRAAMAGGRRREAGHATPAAERRDVPSLSYRRPQRSPRYLSSPVAWLPGLRQPRGRSGGPVCGRSPWQREDWALASAWTGRHQALRRRPPCRLRRFRHALPARVVLPRHHAAGTASRGLSPLRPLAPGCPARREMVIRAMMAGVLPGQRVRPRRGPAAWHQCPGRRDCYGVDRRVLARPHARAGGGLYGPEAARAGQRPRWLASAGRVGGLGRGVPGLAGDRRRRGRPGRPGSACGRRSAPGAAATGRRGPDPGRRPAR